MTRIEEIDRRIAELQAEKERLIHIAEQRQQRTTKPIVLSARARAFLANVVSNNKDAATLWGMSEEERGSLWSLLMEDL